MHAAWLSRMEEAARAGQRVLALAQCEMPADTTALSMTAVLAGLLTYGVITLVWRWRTVAKRRGRLRRDGA